MAWIDDVRSCVQQMPTTFHLADLDPFIPRLHRLHPANQHVQEKVRQQLQGLRDLGELDFVEPGRYRRTDGADGGLPLVPGDYTTREELAELLGMQGPAPLQRGMFKQRVGPFANELLLFHNAVANPYGDEIGEGDRIKYVGQGQTGDQKLDGFNLELAGHLENGTRVHFFVKDQAKGSALRYEGQVVLDKVERVYRQEEGRSVLEYYLIPDRQGASRAEFGRAYREVLEEDLAPHLNERVNVVHLVKRALRDKAFAAHIVDLYQARCAVCGPPLAHPEEKWLDLQGAHVVAVSAGGRDVLNNGICLCARHHWAFDHGIFSIGDSYELILHADWVDPHDELQPGNSLRLPRVEALWPHQQYLDWHRANWRFT